MALEVVHLITVLGGLMTAMFYALGWILVGCSVPLVLIGTRAAFAKSRAVGISFLLLMSVPALLGTMLLVATS